METTYRRNRTRRELLREIGASAALLAATPHTLLAANVSSVHKQARGSKPNVLLITADDLNYDSLGFTGSKTPEISPNLDALAAEGIRFEHAHVTSAICQPSRSAIMTGRYPHRSGALGFDPINVDVPTLTESTHGAGYLNGIMAKVGHLAPERKFCWDVIVRPEELEQGRDPALYYAKCRAFFRRAKEEKKPFFLMANSQDPHRPFPGSIPQGRNAGREFPGVSRVYKPEEVQVPAFLPDLPEIRAEMAQYYTAVHRCDETVGQILRALRESGSDENTLVIFLSDNGISMPFAKTNCYEASTRTPLIVRWPGRIKPGQVDRTDLISGIDIMPTVLEALEITQVPGMDGRSFLPLLEGRKQEDRDMVFTFITSTAGRGQYPMRCVRTARYSYIFNAWSDGKKRFKHEAMGSASYKAMVAAAEKDSKIAARVRFNELRVREEFYDLASDPNELTNQIADSAYRAEIDKMRSAMLKMMTSTGDPLFEDFRKQIGK